MSESYKQSREFEDNLFVEAARARKSTLNREPESELARAQAYFNKPPDPAKRLKTKTTEELTEAAKRSLRSPRNK